MSEKVEIVEELWQILQINVATLIFPVVAAATLLAGVSDAKWYRVSNKITFPLMAIGIAYHMLIPSGKGWDFALAGLSFGLLILLPFFLLGGMGAGDVKLLAGIGACLGLHDTVAVFLVFGTLAGIYSAVAVVAGGRLASTVQSLRHPIRSMSATISEGQRVEEALELDVQTQRSRMVPLATMMAIAVFLLALGRLAPILLS